MKKGPKLDESTRRALETIAYGDKVKFCDCPQAQVYGDKTFRVKSENPIVVTDKKTVYVFVKLHGLPGFFPIGKLQRVAEDSGFSDLEIKQGLKCCLVSPEPNCSECPFVKLGPTLCHQKMDALVDDLIRRLDNFYGGAAQ